MIVGLVTPAWGRPSVTRLVLAQRARLVAELAPRGVRVSCVVIADDENLDIASEHGFDVIEMDNSYLGRKVNAGFAWAAETGCDYAAFIGSDDWLHPDLFTAFDGESIVSGRSYALVDLPTGTMCHLTTAQRLGTPPWFIPAAMLERLGWKPVEDERSSGMEFALGRVLDGRWRMHDVHPLMRVGFKSEVYMTPYPGFAGHGDTWDLLARAYDDDLVSRARALHESYALAEAWA